LIGKRGRRSACLVATSLVATPALALPALAAAGPPRSEEGVVGGSFATSPEEALRYWTPARVAEAEPLPTPSLPDPPPETTAVSEGGEEGAEGTAAATGGGGEEAGPSTETSATAATLAGAAFAGTAAAALSGTEVGFGESTLFPNSANGKIFGEFKSSDKREKYECSGSVIHSSQGNFVLTAGHCVKDPETGALAQNLVFKPGYRNGFEPFGEWAGAFWLVTESWWQSASAGSAANEGNDLALLEIKKNHEDENIEEVVGGGLGIGFDQVCSQTYTQYGYPAETPYGGEILYSHTAPYAGADTNPLFTPAPIKIASDFTRGASGGPWTVAPAEPGAPPTVLSLTAYSYASQPGFLYGPYFGDKARKLYEVATGVEVPAGNEEACKPLPEPPPTPPPTPPSTSTPPTPNPDPPTPPKVVSLKVKKIVRRADGSALVTAMVGSAGMLKLSGSAVRADSLKTPTAGNYLLVVAAKGAAGRRLREQGGAKVGVKISFSASAGTRRITKAIRLSLH
jgi:hypothetical protein